MRIFQLILLLCVSVTCFAQVLNTGLYIDDTGVRCIFVVQADDSLIVCNEYGQAVGYPIVSDFKSFYYKKKDQIFGSDSILANVDGQDVIKERMVGFGSKYYIEVTDSMRFSFYLDNDDHKAEYYWFAHDLDSYDINARSEEVDFYWNKLLDRKVIAEPRISDCLLFATISFRFKGEIRMKNITKYLLNVEDENFWKVNMCPEIFTTEEWNEILEYAKSTK